MFIMIQCKITLQTLFIFIISFFSATSQTVQSEYQFEETINLIEFVESAAKIFSQKGTESFAKFSDKGSKWFKGNKYLFIYDFEGKCIFHPIEKEFVGKNMIDMCDMNGKPVIRFIINIASNTLKPKGWVHYLWAESDEFFPFWKSAYIVRVEDPQGKPYAIGSGTYDIRTERKFIVDVVDSAAHLIEKEGKAAYEKLIDKSSIFYFFDVYMFVISFDGKAIVDPAFPGIKERNLIDFQDAIGKYVVKEIIDKLKDKNKAFLLYLWPRPGQTKLSKKTLYIRKVKVGKENVIVGSGLFIVDPIWK
jgi:signal transduction histidine kinase